MFRCTCALEVKLNPTLGVMSLSQAGARLFLLPLHSARWQQGYWEHAMSRTIESGMSSLGQLLLLPGGEAHLYLKYMSEYCG